MVHSVKGLLLIVIYYVGFGGGWKAIPANQAPYALRASHISTANIEEEKDTKGLMDWELPKDKLSFTYKFGNCQPDVIKPQFFRKSINFTLQTWQAPRTHYLYLIAKKHTRRYYQCIVLKCYAAQKFLFKKSRLPLYYCHGVIWIMMMNTINRYQIHEFYLHHMLNVPLSFSFEFYHPLEHP